MSEFEDTIDNDEIVGKAVRPKFLSVLCVLSWIYVAISVLGSLSNATTPQEDLEAQIEVSRQQIENMPPGMEGFMEDTLNFAEATIEHTKTMNIITLILMLIQGLAVYMMFKLSKNGFWLYTLVQVLLIGVTVYFIPWPNILSTLTITFYVVIVVLFLILYGVNLKHLK